MAKVSVAETASAVRSVREAVRERIASGAYADGGRLPAERDLAVELGVSRSTIRKALRVLEAEGLIWRHVGMGTFVGKPPSQGGSAELLSGLTASPRDIVEARLAVEPIIAGYAAYSATMEDLAFLYKCADRLEAATDWPTFEIWDRAFHRAVAAATQNKVFIAFLDTINRLRENETWMDTELPAITSEKQRQNTARHRLITDAIRRADMHGAIREMRSHLEYVRDLYIDIAFETAPDFGKLAAVPGTITR